MLLDKLSVERDHQLLQVENQQLRGLLKQYLDGISVSEEILNKDNPLFIVNNKNNMMHVPIGDVRVQGKERHTVVEAAHVVKHTI